MDPLNHRHTGHREGEREGQSNTVRGRFWYRLNGQSRKGIIVSGGAFTVFCFLLFICLLSCQETTHSPALTIPEMGRGAIVPS